MKALVDGDIIVYRCAFAAESTRYTLVDEESGIVIGQFDSSADYRAHVKEHELDNFVVERERVIGPLSHALQNVSTTMDSIQAKLGPEEMYVILSDGKGFREDIATIKKYKGNRDDAPRPQWYEEVRKFLVDNYGALVYTSVEADDVLAICQGPDTCIVSIDKDLLQVPGRHYNWVNDERKLVKPEVGIRKLYEQVLTGDSTDNIPGIRGIGPKTATRMLKDVEPTKQALSAVCTDEWEKYLLKEEDGFHKIDGSERAFSYLPWYELVADNFMVVEPQHVAAEIYSLVKVGGSYAKQALEEAGEALPFPISEEG